ncbi:MAG: domain S-box protein [Sphingomonas bacterium]|nr:domain S-box protein [Sphingomonas bacterium]
MRRIADGPGDWKRRSLIVIAISQFGSHALVDRKNESDVTAFSSAGGKVGALMQARDWSVSALGVPSAWPQSLRSVVDLVLGSKFPMFVAWGEELSLLYNDAYVEILGAKHPRSLGLPLQDVWQEIWPDIEPLVHAALAGEASFRENLPLTIKRRGQIEDTWFTFSYSPVRDETGKVAGLFCACAETTAQILSKQQADVVQERQRQMLLQMPGFVAMLSGPDLIFTYINNAYVEISERTDFIGRRFRDVFADISGQGFHELFESVFHTGKGVVTRGMELRLHGRGDVQYVDFVLEPIHDELGVVTGVFVGGYETTEVYQGSETLRASNARLRELNADLERQDIERSRERQRTWEISSDLLSIATPDGMFQSVNPAWTTTLGWSTERVTRTPLFDFIHPDDLARTRKVFGLLQRGDPVLRFENRYAHADGSWRWLSWVAVPVDGKFYCSARDVTHEKEAEAERDRLWELSQDMLARADYAGKLSAVNPAWTQLLGWSEGELLTNPYADIIHPQDVPVTLAALDGMEGTGQPTRFENRVLTKSGEWKPIGWTVSPEPGGVNFIAIGRDLADYKARERELEEAHQALRQSQKMEAMGSLTGGVAHDFNNLLTPIMGSLDMLVRRGLGNERERRLIDGALQSADRAKTLVQRLLAFARRQPLQPIAVDLGALVEGMAGLIGSTIGPNIDLRVDIADDLPPADADPNQLEMAILNLGVNARDAMPHGGTLTIVAARDSLGDGNRSGLEAGEYLRLSVADTGVGMDEATRARAVEPFFSTKGIGKGTGLGLSMVYGLVAQLGGGMAIASEAGQGTKVDLWLPISSHLVENEDVPDRVALPPPARARALLVDDETLVRMSTADMLIDLGYEVVEAGSGDEALRLFEHGATIDLLVTDHLMPGMSGVELARLAQALKPGLPVLVVSGYAELDGVAADLPRLTKPFRNAELADSLGVLLRGNADSD